MMEWGNMLIMEEVEGNVSELLTELNCVRGLIVGCQDTSDPGHFGPKIFRHHQTCRSVQTVRYQCQCLANTSALVPNCLDLQHAYIFLLQQASLIRFNITVITIKEDHWFLANVNSCSCSLYVVVRPSVCRLSVTFVHPSQPIEIFGNVSAPFNTLVTWRHPGKILRRSSQGNPSVGGLNQRVVEKCSYFGPFRGHISETVQDRR